MADNRHHIEPERDTAGRRILEMTDSVGFDAYAAGWIHDIPTKSWRYLLSTPMLTSEGPLWVYRRLSTVFRHMPLPNGISPLDIYVIDPDLEMALFGNMVMIGRWPIWKSGDQSGVILQINHDIKIEEFAVTDGFASFYRRIPEIDRKSHKNPRRTFDRKVRMLEAA